MTAAAHIPTNRPFQAATASGVERSAQRALGRAVSAPGDATPSAPPLREIGAWREMGRKFDSSDPRRVREAATGLASELFFRPLLEEMGKLPFGKGIGHGGRMEEAFQSQLNTRIADHVAAGDPGGLLTLLETRLQRLEPATTPATEGRPLLNETSGERPPLNTTSSVASAEPAATEVWA